MSNDPNEKISKTDSYWNVGDMLPRKKTPRVFSDDTDTVEIRVTSRESSDAAASHVDESRLAIPQGSPRVSQNTSLDEKLRVAREAIKKAQNKLARISAMQAHIDISFEDDVPEMEKAAETVMDEYKPQNNPLIENVKILPWPARYTFYERFRADAVRLFDKEGKECPAVPFFSYTPQYVQLSREQLAFYLWWRTRVRNGEYPEADSSYILLYIYEIINLPDLIKPEDGVRLLCSVWSAYRDKYGKLDRLLSEWVCDYCLIGKVSPPDDIYAPFSDAIIASAGLKEFFVGFDSKSPSPYGSALFAYGSNYNYRKSKFITPENRELFDRHIKAAFLYGFEKSEREDGKAFSAPGRKSMVKVTVTRDAYSGALCAYDVKRRINVEYLSCSRSVELRYTVTDCVKYAENNVRAILGIRSRFHTPCLPASLKAAMDEYFEPYRERAKKAKPAEPAPEYEKLYEPSHADFSPELAQEIEEKSWAVTGLLTDDEMYRDPEPAEADIFAEPDNNETENGGTDDSPAVENEYIKQALSVLLDGEQQHFRAIAAANNLLPDALAEKINDAMFDVLGDAAVEQDGSSYRVIEDYREDVIQWMKE